MTFLYGDSTPSSIDVDYIDFLRKALDCLVEVLLADHKIAGHQRRTRDLDSRAELVLESITSLNAQVHELLAPISSDPTDGATSRLANSIDRAAADLLTKHIDLLATETDRHQRDIGAQCNSELERSVAAIETLVLEYPLPGHETTTTLVWDDESGGYNAAIKSDSPNLGVSFEVEIPANHPFAVAVSVADLHPELELHVPKQVRWLYRQMKSAGKLGRHYIASVVVTAGRTVVELRRKLAREDGVTLQIDLSEHRVIVTDRDGINDFEAALEDWPGFESLDRALRVAASGLAKSSLAHVEFDGAPFASKHLRPFCERTIELIAPVVSEIAKRTLSPTELVLRRKLEGGRREEIFATKADLASRLRELPAALRGLFEPLGLGPVGRAASEMEVELVVETGEPSIELEESDLQPVAVDEVVQVPIDSEQSEPIGLDPSLGNPAEPQARKQGRRQPTDQREHQE